MRKIFMIGISFCLLSCAASKIMPASGGKIVLTSGCGTQATCSGVIHDKKRLELAVNEEGAHTYSLVEDKSAAVITLTYERILPKNVQDGQYREEISFEVPRNAIPVDINLNESSKAVFGRFCYCKGSTGYYPVSSGRLKIEKKNGTLTGHISFQNSEVPQIWKEASFLIK